MSAIVRRRCFAASLLVVMEAVPAAAQASLIARVIERVEPLAARARPSDRRPGEIPFTCGQRTLGDFLAHLDPGVPATVRVSGACTENVVISGFARLTLLAAPGASIADASGGAEFALQVAN